MGWIILAALIGIPLVELWLLIELGGQIGGWWVVGICLLTAAIGLSIARLQGGQILGKVVRDLRARTAPTRPLFDAVCIVGAGFMLLTPGMITDALGLLLLVPPVRGLAFRLVGNRLGALRAAAADPRFADYAARGADGTPHPPQGAEIAPGVDLLPPGAVSVPPARRPPTVIDVD